MLALCTYRYHLLKPQYIYGRIKELQRVYRLRVLLCHVDTEDAVDPLAQVTKAALLNDCTLFCAWSPLVSARHVHPPTTCSVRHVMLIMPEAALLIACAHFSALDFLDESVATCLMV